MITAYVGSGGKTGEIRKQAELLRKKGKRVLVTTTTHMDAEPGAIVGDDPAPVLRALREQGYAQAGQYNERHGLQSLPAETFRAVCAGADEVLVEADGSRQLPLKMPAAHEPVIPEGTDRIVIIAGLSGIGRPAAEVCHRLPLVTESLGIGERTVITAVHVQRMIEEGYVRRLGREHPECELVIRPKQQDSLYLQAVAALLRDRIPADCIRPEWFADAQALLTERGQGCLCVITETEGTAPQGVGTMMLVQEDRVMGSIGGGNAQQEAIREARGCRKVRSAAYDLGCGRIHVLLLPLS